MHVKCAMLQAVSIIMSKMPFNVSKKYSVIKIAPFQISSNKIFNTDFFTYLHVKLVENVT